MTISLRYGAFAALLAFVSGVGLETAFAQEVVGAVGAANAAPTGRAPGQATRTLSPGADIFFKDHLTTKRSGSVQLTFLDRSTLSVGENSDLVIDEFVYKPSGSGSMKASLTRGVLRYVGGDISHGGGTTLTTPTVTIGIRGGIGTIGFVKDAATVANIPGMPSTFHGGTIVINGYGTLSVRNGVSAVEISRPGYGVFIGSHDEAITAPVRIEPSAAKAIMKCLTSAANQHGGGPKGATAPAHNAATPAIDRLANVAIAAERSQGVDPLGFTSAISGGNSLAGNRSHDRQALQLQQTILSSPGSVVATPYGFVVTAPAASGNYNAAPASPGAAAAATHAAVAAAAASSTGHHDNGVGNGGNDNGQGNGNSH